MIFFIILIAVPVIGIAVGLYLAHIEWDGSYIFNAFLGGFFGVVVGILLGGMIATTGAGVAARGNGYSDVETYDLVALATQQETEGSAGMLIFVGWGQVGETRKAYWTATDKDGISQMYSEDAMDIKVKETDTTPRYIKQAMVDDSGFWLPWDHHANPREFLEVPVGTLTANYEFQP